MSDSLAYLEQVKLAQAAASAKYANYTMTMVVVGVHIFMAFYGLFVYLETSLAQREGRAMYIAISFLLTVMSAFSASFDIFRLFKCLLEATGPLGYLETSLKYGWAWERYASVGSLAVIILVGDALLIYRCYIMWKKQWLAVVAPILTYVACVAVAVVTFIPTRRDSTEPTTSQVSNSREAIWVFLNVATNTLVTGLISFRLITSRKELARVLPSKDLNLYTGIVAMLIESVLPLTIAGLVYASVLVSKPESPTVASEVTNNLFSFIYYSLMGLSPHIIIFRVTTNRSWTHTAPCQTSNSEPIQTLRFRQTCHSEMLESTVDGSRSMLGVATTKDSEKKDTPATP